MRDFRVKGESLRWDFITPTTWHSDCLAFELRLLGLGGVCLHKLQFAHEGAFQAGELCFSKPRRQTCAFGSTAMGNFSRARCAALWLRELGPNRQ